MLSSNTSNPSKVISNNIIITEKSPEDSISHITEDETLNDIWKLLKEAPIAKPPQEFREEIDESHLIIYECHRIMKLPIETLFNAVSMFERVIINYHNQPESAQKNIDFKILGIACLYCSQKMEKIRNYGLSYWVKHLSQEALSFTGLPPIHLTCEELKKHEFFIIEILNYNLFSTNLIDILFGIWTLKPPTEKEFYFAHFVMELSIFSNLPFQIEQSLLKNSVPSSSSFTEYEKYERCQLVHQIDIALSIVYLSSFFFGENDYNHEEMIKKIWTNLKENKYKEEIDEKKKIHKMIANILFQKVIHSETDNFCSKINQKYSKHANLSISAIKFSPKASKSLDHHSDCHSINNTINTKCDSEEINHKSS